MKRVIATAFLALLLCSATFAPGRITHLDYDLGPYRGFVLTQTGITLEGDGVYGEDVGIAYPMDPDGTTKDSTAVHLRANALTLRDLVISLPLINHSWGQEAGAGDGIRYDGEGVGEWRTVSGTVLDHVSVLYPGRSCLRVEPGPIPTGGHGYWVSPTLRDCVFYGAMNDGVVVRWTNDSDWTRVTSTRHKGWGFVFDDIGSSRFKITAEAVNGGVWIRKSAACVFEACHFEEFAQDTLKPGLLLDNCHGITVQGSSFSSWGREGATSIKLVNGCTDCTILPNYHAAVKVAVFVDNTCHGNTIYAQSLYNYGAPELRGKLVVDRRKNRVIE